ncbi:endoplasmic reticulum vesicle transporter-domain-containing protein [Gigaspora rosea]|uniref:Endoplasmic reticulum vesicle transporter-domain-containing protein n=1 Tax=Gigaspora rosea TaxID=44941 RepID=A0A397UZK3_9GLOM|nr:endoplasmic reticulum vesicle transporter-domain-containing protein [Gigaspora rosea]
MGKRGSVLSQFQNFDAYAKTLDDFRIKTYYGAALTILSTIIIITLLWSEFNEYRVTEIKPELVVDKSRKEKLTINLNITFPKVPCYLLSVDVMDVAGETQNDLTHDIYKTRLDADGTQIHIEKATDIGDPTKDIVKIVNSTDPGGENYCGSCYGASPPESGCCNTCDEVREAYIHSGWSFNNPDDIEQCVREGWKDKVAEQSKEGCNVAGSVRVNKVAGNFHLAPGKSFQQNHVHVHDLQPFLSDGVQHDFTHEIHHLSFGPKVDGVINPLDGVGGAVTKGHYMFQYFLKVVSTHFYFLNETVIYTNQYSVTQFERDLTGKDHTHSHNHNHMSGLPGVFFNYEISPMLIINREESKSFTHFLTGVCAIVGGIFTVAGILDGFIYNAEKTFKKKVELGKHL